MAITTYFAMTAAEFSACTDLPSHVGWMACHFSPSGPGLSNIPKVFPKQSLLIVDDSAPFQKHQPECIFRQLQKAIADLEVRAVILDFQRPHDTDVQKLVSVLQRELPCPVAASPGYALKRYPVFVSPCPLNRPLRSHLAPYQNQEIWLDVSPFSAQLTVTCKECHYEVLKAVYEAPHWEPKLHCHYNIDIEEESVVFTLIRDHKSWLAEAEKLGVNAAIGLYQEWK